MQPHTPITICGLRCLSVRSCPSVLNTLSSGLRRTEQVLSSTTSASSTRSAGS
jgi:hypothetical protein